VGATKIIRALKSLLTVIVGVKKYATFYFKLRNTMNLFRKTIIPSLMHTFGHQKWFLMHVAPKILQSLQFK